EVVAINPPPPRPPAKSKPESVRGLPVPPPASPPRPPARLVAEDIPMVEFLPARQRSPVKSSEEALDRGDAAAFWVLMAGIGTLATATIFIAGILADLKGEGVGIAFLFMVAFAVVGVLQLLASGSLKNFQGKGLVITAIVFGFILGLAFALLTVIL